MGAPQFFQTGMGRIFFEGTMPRLYRAIGRLADALSGPREYRVINVGADEEELERRLNELGEQGFAYRETLSVEGREMVVLMERVVPRKEQG